LNELSTTPNPADSARKVRIIHPFHPRFGQGYTLVTYRKNWGEERVYFQNEEGRLCSLPVHWTDLLPPDPFQVVAAGRAHFRPQELQQLARLLSGLEAARAQASGKGGVNDCK